MKISVCLASYNGERYIAEQINSILGCLRDQDELIVSDDGSSDSTWNIVSSIKDVRIRLVASNSRSVVGNFKNAVSEASGDIIILCDQDDVWKSDRVSSILEHHQNHGVVVCNAEFCDKELSPKGYTIFDVYRPTNSLIKIFYSNIFVGCTMSFDCKYKTVFEYMPNNTPMHDWLLGLIGMYKNDVFYETRPLFLFRRHDLNASTTGSLSAQKLFKRVKDRFGLLLGFMRIVTLHRID
ncbi:glycosyl transferase family 2 [Ferrimonas balearica DSM 9799]|uniref:Glycosyl transferase family 2 n=1 Tax=Ferrimonas balearica (strain DSM 9799 / CCM 4581 / KCTC 23876 / PAT) TaxID=550540 RepID=E1SUU5_FERBD|nr:glycosyltransferase [Ferrimonas balearica]ADN75286.1 glycosyl transferase family 2 [Ferrimonas balearica DSM 9799]